MSPYIKYLQNNIFKLLLIIIFGVFWITNPKSVYAASLAECPNKPASAYPIQQIVGVGIGMQYDVIDSGQYSCNVITSLYARIYPLYGFTPISTIWATVYVKYLPTSSSLWTKISGFKSANCSGAECGKYTDKNVPSGTTDHLLVGSLIYQKRGSQDACYLCNSTNYCDNLKKGQYNQQLSDAYNSSPQSFITKKTQNTVCKPNYPPPSPTPTPTPTKTTITPTPTKTTTPSTTTSATPTAIPATTNATNSPTASPTGSTTGVPTSAVPSSDAPTPDYNFNLDLPDLPTWGLTWEGITQNIYVLLAWIIGSLLVIMLLIGGVMYITSGGNEEQASRGTKTMTAAIIATLITVAAYGIINYVVQNIK